LFEIIDLKVAYSKGCRGGNCWDLDDLEVN